MVFFPDHIRRIIPSQTFHDVQRDLLIECPASWQNPRKTTSILPLGWCLLLPDPDWRQARQTLPATRQNNRLIRTLCCTLIPLVSRDWGISITVVTPRACSRMPHQSRGRFWSRVDWGRQLYRLSPFRFQSITLNAYEIRQLALSLLQATSTSNVTPR